MKNQYLSSALTLLFLFLFACGFSQDLDLIVTTQGDSIVCRIDSIIKTHIYFEMKSQDKWAHTNIDHTDVSEYKRNAIHRNQFVYKTGTSIIVSSKPAIPASLYQVRKNSVYVGILSINYARMIPLSQKTGFTLGGGLINIDGWGVVAESSMLFGGVKHFLEPGIMGAYFFEPSTESDEVFTAVTLRLGYRYQAPWGLLFRVAPNFIFSTEKFYVLAALSIGYSF